MADPIDMRVVDGARSALSSNAPTLIGMNGKPTGMLHSGVPQSAQNARTASTSNAGDHARGCPSDLVRIGDAGPPPRDAWLVVHPDMRKSAAVTARQVDDICSKNSE